MAIVAYRLHYWTAGFFQIRDDNKSLFCVTGQIN